MTDDGIAHLRELAHWLSLNGCGAVGAAITANMMPDHSTGPMVAIIEVPGMAPQNTYGGAMIRMPRFRIDVRSTAPTSTQHDYPDVTRARRLAQTAWDACNAVAGTQIASTGASSSTGNWLLCEPETDPYLAARDNNNRVVFSFVAQGQRQGP